MGKVKKAFVCTNCGVTSAKWVGKCNSCGEWNTYVEEIIERASPKVEKTWKEANAKAPVPTLVKDIKSGETQRVRLTDPEFNRVLGNGLVRGSVVLIGGHPGIGKSTLLLQVALHNPINVLYVSGEESEEQIKMRAERLEIAQEKCFVLTQTNVEKILKHAVELQPDLIVVDSIQTVYSSHLDAIPGSISQIRESAYAFQRFAKETQTAVVLIGHINKEGSLAGPKLLEHIVDVVLQFEGDQQYHYRLLRSIKNRFGATHEIGIYEMKSAGLFGVENPSEMLISQKDADLSGSAIAATLNGRRPMLIEAQALVSQAVYGNPQRTATGFDLRRLSMLLAVLEKRGGFAFGMNDVFLNIAGGLKVDDPAIDLAIVAALVSSLENISLPHRYCFSGEIGLSGEIRTVQSVEQRIQEASRLGFEKIFISKFSNLSGQLKGIEVVQVAKVEQFFDFLFND